MEMIMFADIFNLGSNKKTRVMRLTLLYIKKPLFKYKRSDFVVPVKAGIRYGLKFVDSGSRGCVAIRYYVISERSEESCFQ